MNHVGKRAQGFTLIELMLAMAFISALLLAIALTIIQIGTIYNRGLALKDINQAARDIASDVQRTISASGAADLTSDYVETSAGGRVCLGSYSYIWNFAKTLELTPGNSNLVKFAGDASKTVRLVKVPDATKQYCAKDSGGALRTKDILTTDTKTAQDVLAGGEHNLGVQKFTITSRNSAYDATIDQRLYTLDYTLGTGSVNAMNSDQSACLAPSNLNSDLTYCNVQTFSLVLRAGNRVN
ncbi:prepilin-type N-terminal cleavage/methylation domain-containing protein [Candidatus Saccharibacteria bacterium]|nr:prepilin-type N-terminal cleavage/methylation domain-containing protein [Candidatus Saccharibacteria bacterium]